MESFVGSVFAFGFNFAPIGWLPCDGRLIAISEYEVLYALIGTTYGGNGTTTFAVPNLQGRVPIGVGQGPGLSNYVLGQAAGTESVTLTSANLPGHTHPVLTATIPASATNGESADPTGRYFGLANATTTQVYATTSSTGINMAANTSASGSTGSNLPIEIMNPYQVVSYCICTQGIYPTQN